MRALGVQRGTPILIDLTGSTPALEMPAPLPRPFTSCVRVGPRLERTLRPSTLEMPMGEFARGMPLQFSTAAKPFWAQAGLFVARPFHPSRRCPCHRRWRLLCSYPRFGHVGGPGAHLRRPACCHLRPSEVPSLRQSGKPPKANQGKSCVKHDSGRCTSGILVIGPFGVPFFLTRGASFPKSQGTPWEPSGSGTRSAPRCSGS